MSGPCGICGGRRPYGAAIESIHRQSAKPIGLGTCGHAAGDLLRECAMNQHCLAHLDPRAWRAGPPGPRGSGRTIAAIFSHLHNRRLGMAEEFGGAVEVSGGAQGATEVSNPLAHWVQPIVSGAWLGLAGQSNAAVPT